MRSRSSQEAKMDLQMLLLTLFISSWSGASPLNYPQYNAPAQPAVIQNMPVMFINGQPYAVVGYYNQHQPPSYYWPSPLPASAAPSTTAALHPASAALQASAAPSTNAALHQASAALQASAAPSTNTALYQASAALQANAALQASAAPSTSAVLHQANAALQANAASQASAAAPATFITDEGKVTAPLTVPESAEKTPSLAPAPEEPPKSGQFPPSGSPAAEPAIATRGGNDIKAPAESGQTQQPSQVGTTTVTFVGEDPKFNIRRTTTTTYMSTPKQTVYLKQPVTVYLTRQGYQPINYQTTDAAPPLKITYAYEQHRTETLGPQTATYSYQYPQASVPIPDAAIQGTQGVQLTSSYTSSRPGADSNLIVPVRSNPSLAASYYPSKEGTYQSATANSVMPAITGQAQFDYKAQGMTGLQPVQNNLPQPSHQTAEHEPADHLVRSDPMAARALSQALAAVIESRNRQSRMKALQDDDDNRVTFRDRDPFTALEDARIGDIPLIPMPGFPPISPSIS